jgi:hypothetical protein
MRTDNSRKLKLNLLRGREQDENENRPAQKTPNW